MIDAGDETIVIAGIVSRILISLAVASFTETATSPDTVKNVSLAAVVDSSAHPGNAIVIKLHSISSLGVIKFPMGISLSISVFAFFIPVSTLLALPSEFEGTNIGYISKIIAASEFEGSNIGYTSKISAYPERKTKKKEKSHEVRISHVHG